MPGDTNQRNSHEDNNQSPYLESASQIESTGRPAKKNTTEEHHRRTDARTYDTSYLYEWREECPISISTCYTTPIQISPSSKTNKEGISISQTPYHSPPLLTLSQHFTSDLLAADQHATDALDKHRVPSSPTTAGYTLRETYTSKPASPYYLPPQTRRNK
jgi:hypothetical protein